MKYRLLVVLLLFGLLGVWQRGVAHAGQRCFVETNQCIDGRIAEFWQQNGGLAVFGLPLGAPKQTTIDGATFVTQRFERYRLELHPENQRPYDVLVGRLGADRLGQQGRDWFTFPKTTDTGGCRVFAETGHAVCGEFLAMWQSHGIQLDAKRGLTPAESLALFGLPLSGIQTEKLSDGKQYQVQWFERARFELHPENPAPYNVLLGLLGSEDLAFKTRPNPAAATATPRAPAAPAPTATPAGLTAEQLAFRVHDMPAGYWSTSAGGMTLAAGGIRFHRELYWASASPGNKLARFSLNIRNDRGAGGDPLYLNPWRFTLVDVEGRTYTYSSATYQLTDIIDSRDIYPGEQGGGDIVFEIAKDTSPAKLIYQDYSLAHPVVLVFDNNVHQ